MEIGQVTAVPNTFEWEIPNFLGFSNKPYRSSSFSFAGQSWFLGIYPRGSSKDNSVGISLFKKFSGPQISMNFTLLFKTSNGKKLRELRLHHTFKEAKAGFGFNVPLSELLEKTSDCMMPLGIIIVCTMEYISACNSHYDPTIQKMVNDLKSMLESGKHSDTTIKVKGSEFKLHRNILSARNPFFNSMFECEMKEKMTGIVTIDDCEPKVFRSFAHFLYTGKVDKFSSENVCDLYEVADKYQENLLKAECLEFMVNSITAENFCDYFILAVKYEEKKLFSRATKFFARNTKEIICTAKWMTFLKEHPVHANELHIRSLDSHACSSGRENTYEMY